MDWSRKPSRRTPADAFRDGIAVLGGQDKAVKVVRRSQGAISKRLAAGKPIWEDAVLRFEKATGIPRYEQRPDLYPPEEYANTQSSGARPGEAPAAASLDAAGARDGAPAKAERP